MSRWILTLSLAVFLWPREALARDEEQHVKELQERIAVLEKENHVLRQKVLWHELLAAARLPRSATRVDVLRLGPGSRQANERSEHLKGIRLPDRPSKSAVREYVGRILEAAQDHRQVFESVDPEIALLEAVGPANVDILIEPLVYLPHIGPSYYLIEALDTLVGAEHKELILDNLAAADDARGDCH